MSEQVITIDPKDVKPAANQGIRTGKRGRPKGIPRPAGEVKRSGKLSEAVPEWTAQEILGYKVAILELLMEGKAHTLTQCAHMLNLSPLRVHRWARQDKDFKEYVDLALEVVADEIEERFRHHSNFIPQAILLKGIRARYRDNYRVELDTARMEKLLTDLKRLAKPKTNES